MSERTGVAKLAGRIAGIAGLVGVALYMFGLLGPVRNVLWFGLGLIIVAIVAFFLEEFGPGKAVE